MRSCAGVTPSALPRRCSARSSCGCYVSSGNRGKPAETPDAYVATLSGWQRKVVEALRSAVRGAAKLDDVVKWGHLVYYSHGPVLMIRAEDERVLFGFWR